MEEAVDNLVKADAREAVRGRAHVPKHVAQVVHQSASRKRQNGRSAGAVRVQGGEALMVVFDLDRAPQRYSISRQWYCRFRLSSIQPDERSRARPCSGSRVTFHE